MNILILTEGGKGIGFGHIARCGAIYQALMQKNASPNFVVNGDNSVRGILKGKKYKIFDWLKQPDKLACILAGADVAIIDSYLAGAEFYRKVSKAVDLAVYIDDNKRLDYPDGVVVNGNIHAGSLVYPKRAGVSYLLGSGYAPLREEFWAAPSKRFKKDIESVIITFGGDDSRNLTVKVMRLLVSKYPRLVKNVIVGKAFKNIELLKELKDDRTRLIYNPDTKTIKDIMLKSDAAISAGGQTVAELAKVGTPAIVIGVADNQLNNIKMWKNKGFIKYAGWWKDGKTLRNVVTYLNYMRNIKTRKTMSQIGRDLVDGKGAKRIAEKIMKVN